MVVHGYSTLLDEVPMPGAAAHRRLSPVGLRNDELGQHLADVSDWAQRTGGGSPALPGVLDHLRHVHWHFVADVPTADLAPYRDWARRANGLLRVGDDALLDAAGHPLLGADDVGQVPVHPQSVARAERIRRELAARDLAVPPGALPVRSTEEVRPRRADLVGRRAVALVVTADFALSVLDGQPLDWRAIEGVFPLAFADRTPSELQLFTDEDPELAKRLKWSYEAAAQLMAMCGRVDPVFPTDFADQGQIWNATVGIEERWLLPSLKLLSPGEVCEEWERARALHHAVLSARAAGQRPPGGLDPQIVTQRYRAMEWLTSDQNWDDVSADVPCRV